MGDFEIGSRPDYEGGGIVNLMASVISARGGGSSLYQPSTLLDTARLSRARNLVVLVIDGLGYRFLTSEGSGTTLHRYLQGRMTSVFPSTTATAITTFLTGTAPQQHGLTGWFTYFSELDTIAAVLPFHNRADGRSLARPGFDSSTLFQHAPVFDLLETPSYTVLPARIASSPYNLAHTGNAKVRRYETLGELFANLETLLRDNNESKYVYAYWPELDHLAHHHGIDSRVVKKHLRQLDQAFSRFLPRVENSDSVIIVTADHGLIDSPPSRHIELDTHPQLAETLSRPLCGERRASYCYVDPDKRRQFENYVRDELHDQTEFHSSETLIEQGWFGLGKPNPQLAQRVGDYTLIMKDNYTVKDWLPGERRNVLIGTHGGLSKQEMYVPLIVIEA